ncbi:MAG: hypothetical protein CL945_09485 [Dinoroseobacter sp.]|jgi:cytochrome c556|nr:hypothetical protein [Dinoroseobacter sp.]MAX72431.1 hypothetical protein [Nioella sp.]|tara:strand:- start:132 stop:416 length:285 start_codon:yes stop_codon:yes gene_type:complete
MDMSDQKDFFNQAKAQMEKWQSEMQKLQKQAMETGQEHMKTQLEALNAQRKEAEKQLETMANANSAAMKDMQAGVDKAWKEMEKSMESARKRFE